MLKKKVGKGEAGGYHCLILGTLSRLVSGVSDWCRTALID